MKDMTLEQIKEELHEVEYLTVLTDESKDTRKKDQVIVAVTTLSLPIIVI